MTTVVDPKASSLRLPYETGDILTEFGSSEWSESHWFTSVRTSTTSASGALSLDTSATRWRRDSACALSASSEAPSNSGGAATWSFLMRSGWKDFRQSGQAFGERFRRHLVGFKQVGCRRERISSSGYARETEYMTTCYYMR